MNRNLFCIFCLVTLSLLVLLYPEQCLADGGNMTGGILDTVKDEFAKATVTWGPKMQKYAVGMFGALAVIGIVWTLMPVLFRQAAFGEVFGEILRIVAFVGFFLWVLQNGPGFAMTIVNDMKALGAQAGGSELTPSGIVNLGWEAFDYAKKADTPDLWGSLGPYFFCLLIACVNFVFCGLIAIRVLLEEITCWFVAYAGIFFLGFGGSRFTNDMAVGYLRYALGSAASLMTMYLLAGLGVGIVRSSATVKDLTNCNVDTYVTLLVASLAIFLLISKVPPLITAIITGGSSGSAFGAFTAGAAIGGVANAAKSLNVAAKAIGSRAKMAGNKGSQSKTIDAAQQKQPAKAGH